MDLRQESESNFAWQKLPIYAPVAMTLTQASLYKLVELNRPHLRSQQMPKGRLNPNR